MIWTKMKIFPIWRQYGTQFQLWFRNPFTQSHVPLPTRLFYVLSWICLALNPGRTPGRVFKKGGIVQGSIVLDWPILFYKLIQQNLGSWNYSATCTMTTIKSKCIFVLSVCLCVCSLSPSFLYVCMLSISVGTAGPNKLKYV